MENTSLDEFAQTNSEESDGEDGTEQEPTTENGEADAVEPPTSRLVPDGVDCQRCERSTNRLWSHDGVLVCRNCTDW